MCVVIHKLRIHLIICINEYTVFVSHKLNNILYTSKILRSNPSENLCIHIVLVI